MTMQVNGEGVRDYFVENNISTVDSSAKTKLRKNSSLKPYDWEQIDRDSVAVQRDILSASGDLLADSSLQSRQDIRELFARYTTKSAFTQADITQEFETAVSSDKMDYDINQTPIPLASKMSKTGYRSERDYITSDSTIEAITVVSEAVEDLVLGKRTFTAGRPSNFLPTANTQVLGYTIHPDRITYTLTADWTSGTGQAIKADVQNMVSAVRSAGINSSGFVLYVPVEYYNYISSEDYSTQYPNFNILQKILQIGAVSGVRQASRLGANEIVMVRLNRDTVQMGVASQITSVEIPRQHAFSASGLLVFGAMTPMLKPDYDDKLALVHATT